jgi:hypothetical protein
MVCLAVLVKVSVTLFRCHHIDYYFFQLDVMVSKEQEETMDDLVKNISDNLIKFDVSIRHILGDPGPAGFPGTQGKFK